MNSNMPNLTPQALRNLNLTVFPLTPKKTPAIPKGTSWKTYQGEVNTPMYGVAVPEGVIVLDLDTYKGITKEQAAKALGCKPKQFNWEAAELQTTLQGGKHYAFRCDGDIPQGQSIKGCRGLDIRSHGKGYIASGQGYQQNGAMMGWLASPENLPYLPVGALLEMDRIENVPPPVKISIPEHQARDMLSHIPPDCRMPIPWAGGHGPRAKWIEILAACKSAGVSFEVFDEWSRGDLHGGHCPDNYSSNSMRHQWNSIKPEGGITGRTLEAYAEFHGWRRDWSSVFSAKAELDQVLKTIVEHASDPLQIKTIVYQIRDTPLDQVDRQVALNVLSDELKTTGLWNKDLDNTIKATISHKGGNAPTERLAELPERIAFKDLAVVLSTASSNHGHNAALLLSNVFQSRLKMSEGGFRWWDGTAWTSVPNESVSTAVASALMPDHAMKSTIEGTCTLLRMTAPELPPPVNTTAMYFVNGVLDVERNVWVQHDRLSYNRSRLSVAYNTTAKCEDFLRFVSSIFGGYDDEYERTCLLQEIIGYALIDATLNVQKAIALDGVSRGGKGVVMEVIMALRGANNYGTTSFNALHEAKHQGAFIRHTLMLDMEAKSPPRARQSDATAFFNKMVSGEYVSIPVLYKNDPFEGRLENKLIVACNGIPQLRDDSGATSNRWVTLQFEKTFVGREDKGLARRLTRPAELEGIAAWAVEGVRRLLTSGGQFTLGQSSIEAISDLREVNQPLMQYLEDRLVFGAGQRCHSKDLYADFRAWAIEAGEWIPGKTHFSRTMRQMLQPYPVKYHRGVRVGSKSLPGYTGVGLPETLGS
jgi:P4 family phage/plasmid primase-like protien